MTGSPGHGTDGALANQVEGYLLWQARIAEAEQRARDFTGPLDWLTTAQREEVERRYVTDSLRRARADLERVAARCVSLRAEYEHRYAGLRRRCLALTIATTAAVCVGCTTVTALMLAR